jgi:hypothetical protein
MLISKINFKIYKKYYFNIFINKKIHKKNLPLQSQTPPRNPRVG